MIGAGTPTRNFVGHSSLQERFAFREWLKIKGGSAFGATLPSPTSDNIIDDTGADIIFDDGSTVGASDS